MKYIESDIVELKREFTEDIKRTVIAFANTNGGNIYIGVDNYGNVVGVDNADTVCLQAVAFFRNSIKPDITMFIKAKIEKEEGKDIVNIEVGRGAVTPYYIAEKGLKPSGVFIRVGTSTVQAMDSHIRNMIKETDKDKYILQRSLNQSLTFVAAKEEFEKNALQFGEVQMISLGIIDSNKQYTNLGLLLSDQCEHTIKLAIFEGTTKAVFRDRKEFGGSLFKQLNNAFDYIELINKVHATFDGLRRIDKQDYPPVAIREALLNAVVHRDYSLSGSTFINIYDNKLEILSLGGLVFGLSLDAIKQGYSLTRNEKLANVFYKLKLIEAYGTGIPRIWDLYKDYAVKPEIDLTDAGFRIIFPNSNYGKNGEKVIIKKVSVKDEETILAFINEHGVVSRQDVVKGLNFKSTQAYNVLTALTTQGKIKSKKNGKQIQYFI